MLKILLSAIIFTLISCVNNKQTPLDKTEINSLNKKENTTFKDKKIDKEQTPIKENTNDSIKTFSADNLIKTYFNPIDFRTDSIALIDKEDELFEIEFLKTEYYRQDGDEFTLAFFSVHHLIEVQNKLMQDISTAAIGSSKFSIIKFIKEDDEWIYINKWDNLDIGINIRGETYISHIIQKNGQTFLELPDIVFYACGTKEKLTSLFNTKNFKKSLEINSSSFNGIDDIDEFVTSMNQEIHDKEGSLTKDFLEDTMTYLSNASDFKLEYKTAGHELFINVYRTNGYFNEKKKKFIKQKSIETYKYDKKTLKFSKINDM